VDKRGRGFSATRGRGRGGGGGRRQAGIYISYTVLPDSCYRCAAAVIDAESATAARPSNRTRNIRPLIGPPFASEPKSSSVWTYLPVSPLRPSSSPTSVARPFVERRFQFASR